MGKCGGGRWILTIEDFLEWPVFLLTCEINSNLTKYIKLNGKQDKEVERSISDWRKAGLVPCPCV